MEKYQPGEHDKTAGVLQAAHVREGDYFSSRVHHDIDAIMEDIREAHRGRSDSARRIPLWTNSSGIWRKWRTSRAAGGTTADGVLQANEAALYQADRGRKTMADPDCPKIRTGEKLCAAEGKKKIESDKLYFAEVVL